MLRLIVGSVVSILFMIGIASLGGAAWAGAHIFWDVKVAYIGAPIGAILAIGLIFAPISKLKRSILLGALAVIAFIVARYGQTQFAASFGDDQQAGVFWYFGWIATCAGITALLSSIIAK